MVLYSVVKKYVSVLCIIFICNTAITCSPLVSVANGDVMYSTNSASIFIFGSTATYSCTEGFLLQGNTERSCGGNGRVVNGVWSGLAPLCIGTP